MPEYLYVAQTPTGSIERGRIDGSNRAEARQKLSKEGRRLVGIEEAKQKRLSSSGSEIHRILRVRRLRSIDIELILRQLSVMLESGLELSSSLRELSLHCPKRRQQQLCARLADAVEQGKNFANAVSESGSFPVVVSQLVRVGEETGELPTMLRRAVDFIEKRRQIFSNLVSALSYPSLVAIAACSVAAYLVGWAIPKLTVFLDAMGKKLPAMTQSLIDVSQLVQTYGIQVMVLLATFAISLVLTYTWRPGRYRIDKSILRVPVVGSLLAMVETYQLASSLALMLRSGVFLPEALDTASKLHRNQFLAAKVAKSNEQLANGKDLAGCLSGHGFGPLLPSMIAVGERTGELPSTLEHVAKFYNTIVESRIKRFNRLVEPVIIVIVGGMVGYVYIAFFMALMSAGGNFK